MRKAIILISGILIVFLFFTYAHVLNKTIPIKNSISDAEKKRIYLTFDDGPSKGITPRILDILKANNIKATFFVVGNKISECKDIMLRINNEGHSIGLHTYTHKYKKVYSSQEAFIDEMQKTSDEIYKVLGIRPKIIRFPGGSKKHLNNEFEIKLKNLGYRIFDWNISAADGFNNNISSDKIFRNCIDKKEKFNRAVVLMHCSAENIQTVYALPSIIKHYRQCGYEFYPIDNETPEYYFKY